MAAVDSVTSKIKLTGDKPLLEAMNRIEQWRSHFKENPLSDLYRHFGDLNGEIGRSQQKIGVLFSSVRSEGGLAGGQLAGMVGALRPLPLHFAKVAQDIGKLVLQLIEVGIASAQARREMQISAEGIGTTAQGIDTLRNFFNIFSLGKEKAGQWATASAEAMHKIVEAAKTGDDVAKEQLEQAGLNIYRNGKDGEIKDISVLVREAVTNEATFREHGDMERAQAAGSVSGLDKKQQIVIRDSGLAVRDYDAEHDRQMSLRPTLTDSQESKSTRVERGGTQAKDKMDALWDAVMFRFNRLGVHVADNTLPMINQGLDTVHNVAKFIGVVPETPKEEAARIETRNKHYLLESGKREKAGAYQPNAMDTAALTSEVARPTVRPQASAEAVNYLQNMYMMGNMALAPYQIQQSANDAAMQASRTSTLNGNGNSSIVNNIVTNVYAPSSSVGDIAAAASSGARSGATSLVKGSNASTGEVLLP